MILQGTAIFHFKPMYTEINDEKWCVEKTFCSKKFNLWSNENKKHAFFLLMVVNFNENNVTFFLLCYLNHNSFRKNAL